MKVLPLAADSLGVRSMATLVEEGGVRILIDPGVEPADGRAAAPPDRQGNRAEQVAAERVIAALCQAGLVVLTQWRPDHANLLPYVLSSSAVYAKSPSGSEERWEAEALVPRLRAAGLRFSPCEGSVLSLKDLSLTFSGPLPHSQHHGAMGRRAVIAVAVRSGQTCFVHASDADVCCSGEAFEWVIRQRPDLLYLGGPSMGVAGPGAAGGGGAPHSGAARAILRLMDRTGCRVILDHLAVGDAGWDGGYEDVFASPGVQTVAGYLGVGHGPAEPAPEERPAKTGDTGGPARQPAVSEASARHAAVA